MKKLLTVMLCGLAMMTMVACSDEKEPSEDDIRGEQTTNEDTKDEDTKDEDTKDEETSGEEATGEETADEEAGQDEFSLGQNDGLKYENAFIGIGCTLPEGWNFYSDEEIMELNNYTAEVMGEDYEEMMKNAQIIYDMYADDATGMSNINVNLEKVDNRQLAGIEIADIFAQNLSAYEEMYKSMGVSNVAVELATFEIEGEEFSGITISGDMGGMMLYQKCFSVKCNGYLASVAITTFDTDLTDDILANFYLVD